MKTSSIGRWVETTNDNPWALAFCVASSSHPLSKYVGTHNTRHISVIRVYRFMCTSCVALVHLYVHILKREKEREGGEREIYIYITIYIYKHMLHILYIYIYIYAYTAGKRHRGSWCAGAWGWIPSPAQT